MLFQRLLNVGFDGFYPFQLWLYHETERYQSFYEFAFANLLHNLFGKSGENLGCGVCNITILIPLMLSIRLPNENYIIYMSFII